MDPLIEKTRLFEEVPIDEEVLKEATAHIINARRRLALSGSVVAAVVMGMCHFTFTRSPKIETFAVKLTGDGNPLLMVNPDFLIKIGPEQALFALVHEAYHLMMVHLNVDRELMKNQLWITATEAVINYRINKHLGLDLIKVDGKVAIVDPTKVYEEYRKGMKEQNDSFVTKEQFFATDLGCFSHLSQLVKPPKPPKEGACVHADDAASNGDGSDGGAPLDPDEVNKFMERVLASAVTSAKGGSPEAAKELLNWMDGNPERSEMWGEIGAGSLRGETTKSSKTDLWAQWTAEKIGTRMQDGNAWRYNRKIPWDPRVSSNGKQPKKHGAVFVDASGSMYQEVLDEVAAMIGDMENIEVEWHSFDGVVWPFNTGEDIRGGGGTSFQIIEDHLYDENDSAREHTSRDCCEEDQDFVLVITDGYAPEITPRDLDKWIWLIVKPGTEESCWPTNRGMDCRFVDII